MQLLKTLQALLGSADAQMALAVSYGYGPPAHRDQRRAIYWAQRAVKSGATGAGMTLVSLLHESGAPQHAIRQLIAACERTAASEGRVAQFNLGHCHEQGIGVPRDLEKALYWYTTAANHGDREAELAVARLCRKAPTN